MRTDDAGTRQLPLGDDRLEQFADRLVIPGLSSWAGQFKQRQGQAILGPAGLAVAGVLAEEVAEPVGGEIEPALVERPPAAVQQQQGGLVGIDRRLGGLPSRPARPRLAEGHAAGQPNRQSPGQGQDDGNSNPRLIASVHPFLQREQNVRILYEHRLRKRGLEIGNWGLGIGV